eukprot:172571-Prorocentrum_minimum.AAC.1
MCVLCSPHPWSLRPAPTACSANIGWQRQWASLERCLKPFLQTFSLRRWSSASECCPACPSPSQVPNRGRGERIYP